jgi:hypothetical protein
LIGGIFDEYLIETNMKKRPKKILKPLINEISIINLAFRLKGVIIILINKGPFLIGGPVSF